MKVASADYEAFCQKYNVVENGGELVGGYGEKKLAAYSVKANVTDATNGLKTVTKNEDGSFSFSARQAGSESGIEGQALKTAPDAEDVYKRQNDSYINKAVNGTSSKTGVVTVSYTHLDVYKRQGINRSFRMQNSDLHPNGFGLFGK